jgi:hypothetical protein
MQELENLIFEVPLSKQFMSNLKLLEKQALERERSEVLQQ